MDLLKEIKKEQNDNGQIKACVINISEGWSKQVEVITPTYLSIFLLRLYRESRTDSNNLLDSIITAGTDFLMSKLYVDHVSGLLVSHFNAFYPPDWEDTCMATLLCYKAGRLSKRQLLPLLDLMKKNITSQGVGVWVKDDYSLANGNNNVFDPVVANTIRLWLREIWNEDWIEINQLASSDKPSLYYPENLKKFLIRVITDQKIITAPSLSKDAKLFHHSNRDDVWYGSEGVMNVFQFLVN
ncbi:MAG TPA: hypothetical protein PK720_01505 [bacterium]|nr:hypothetical protein [bacterium]